MILTLNPGGDGTHFRDEDLIEFKKGNFSVQSFHDYITPRNSKNKMAKAIRNFFENDRILKKTVVIPILCFRSKNYDHWKKEFTKLNSEKVREEAEMLSYELAKRIILKVRPKKILIVGFETLDKVDENESEKIQLYKEKKSYYGKSKQRVYSVGKWDEKPFFCIRHLTGAIPKVEDKKQMKKQFLKFLKN